MSRALCTFCAWIIPEGRLRAIYGSISWPTHSPDLNPVDFFYSGSTKEKLYFKPVKNVIELLQRIVQAVEEMNLAGYSRVIKWSFLKGVEFSLFVIMIISTVMKDYVSEKITVKLGFYRNRYDPTFHLVLDYCQALGHPAY
ncbi:hypothetical protein TNCV_2460301 [Trichonephila clavipes]|nr:hypothetical protein TNCV_2460301 [Trichonephila clavipes]